MPHRPRPSAKAYKKQPVTTNLTNDAPGIHYEPVVIGQ
jgi:hypothetical protein